VAVATAAAVMVAAVATATLVAPVASLPGGKLPQARSTDPVDSYWVSRRHA